MIRFYLVLLYCVIFQQHVVSQEFSLILENDVFETEIYYNNIITYNEGFFALFTTGETKANLVISKFDRCFNHVWTKQYNSGFDLSLQDVLIQENMLVVLCTTHLNSSTTRSPILSKFNLDGELIFSYKYNFDDFDNFISLSYQNNQFHLFGPTTNKDKKGGGYFAVSSNSGELLHANILIDKVSNVSLCFGGSAFNNGFEIRRHGKTLITTNQNLEIIWSKRFVNQGLQELSEMKPLILEDGIVHIYNSFNSLTIFKMDFQGNIIWSKKGNGQYLYNSSEASKNKIGLIWRSEVLDHQYALTYTEFDSEDGTVLTNNIIEDDIASVIVWPTLTFNERDDLIITGSIDAEVRKDVLLVNPMYSECLSISDANPFEDVSIELENVDEEYEIIQEEANQEKVSFNSMNVEQFLIKRCQTNSSTELTLDTILDCNNSFVFDGTQYGSKFTWEDGEIDSIRSFTSAQNISVLINECRETIDLNLNIRESECSCDIYTPNIVSKYSINPLNNHFQIRSNCEFENYTLLIYDRWGNLIHKSLDIKESWYPDYQNLSQGVYAWILKYQQINNPNEQYKSGTITLVK